jgi:putative proteasome-type protease
MTYCVGLALDEGLVVLSDTRTNAGVDHISTFAKSYVFEKPGERALVLTTAGNLAISQAVINLLNEGIENPTTGKQETLFDTPTMFRTAALVGAAIRRVFKYDAEALGAQGVKFDVSFLVGGQIDGRPMRLFHVYSAGNFVEATTDTPFFQIGETKYGKPILDRAVNHATTLKEAIKIALISMDSTLRSNLTVGMPVDLTVIRRGSHTVALQKRITEADPYFAQAREDWSQSLRAALKTMPSPGWLQD